MENRQTQDVALSSAASSTAQELQEAHNKIHSLEGVLEAVRRELDEQRNELDAVRSSLQEKIVHVQTELSTAEEELASTKLKMMEVENERLNNAVSPSSSHRQENDHRETSDSSLQEECNRLQDQNRMSGSMIIHLENEIKQLQSMLLSANGDKTLGSNYVEEKSSMEDLMSIDESNIDDILQSNDSELIAKEVRSMAKKISNQKSHNAELLTRILKLQGNIQVCCRIRPMSVDESQQGLHEVAQSLSESDVACFDERTRMWKSYAFDKVWGPESTQKDVFQDVEPMVLSVIDGYNACIFAYGQSE